MQAKILIVSPVRNERAHIDRVVRAVAAQELLPQRWLVIDDGSTDGTGRRLRELASGLPFMSVSDTPADPVLDAARDRLAMAAEIRNFNAALRSVDLRSYTHVMKLDGDIELPPHYLRSMVERFSANPRLGLAGGVLVEPTRGGAMRRIAIPRHHVHGALKLFSVDCLTAIGGIPERLAWDTIDETYARMRGFDTLSFPELVSVHHRPLASANGKLRGRARHGECAYIVHYPATWVALRSLKVAAKSPAGASGGAFLFGYLRAAIRGTEQVPDAQFRRFTRDELRTRMTHSLTRRITSPFGGREADHESKELNEMPIQQVTSGEVYSGG